jgi:hypothetical protein
LLFRVFFSVFSRATIAFSEGFLLTIGGNKAQQG